MPRLSPVLLTLVVFSGASESAWCSDAEDIAESTPTEQQEATSEHPAAPVVRDGQDEVATGGPSVSFIAPAELGNPKGTVSAATRGHGTAWSSWENVSRLPLRLG